MRGKLAFLMALALGGCGQSQSDDNLILRDCPASLVRYRAAGFVLERVKQIKDVNSRKWGCDLLALNIGKGVQYQTDLHLSDDPMECLGADFEGSAEKMLAQYAKRLNRVCPTLDKDISRYRLEADGERVLNSLSPSERKQIEDAWPGR